jgi:hypothetical protein
VQLVQERRTPLRYKQVHRWFLVRSR